MEEKCKNCQYFIKAGKRMGICMVDGEYTGEENNCDYYKEVEDEQ